MRIFIGTEPRQGRAERVLEYSLRKHASTNIDITWMRRGDPGWDDATWPVSTYTEFTTFRCMVPHLLADGEIGIYLDVDILVLDDIAKMYALGRPNEWVCNQHGHTAVSVVSGGLRDYPSVQEVQSTRLKLMDWPKHCDKAMDAWHCRGRLRPHHKLIHFTNMKLQPWKPIPEDFPYDLEHPNANLWHQYEQESLNV